MIIILVLASYFNGQFNMVIYFLLLLIYIYSDKPNRVIMFPPRNFEIPMPTDYYIGLFHIIREKIITQHYNNSIA